MVIKKDLKLNQAQGTIFTNTTLPPKINCRFLNICPNPWLFIEALVTFDTYVQHIFGNLIMSSMSKMKKKDLRFVSDNTLSDISQEKSFVGVEI